MGEAVVLGLVILMLLGVVGVLVRDELRSRSGRRRHTPPSQQMGRRSSRLSRYNNRFYNATASAGIGHAAPRVAKLQSAGIMSPKALAKALTERGIDMGRNAGQQGVAGGLSYGSSWVHLMRTGRCGRVSPIAG